MRAHELQAFGLEHLVPVERPEPRPGPRQALVRLHAASLNYRDLLVARGVYNPRLKFPRVPLSDGVGEVVAVGEGATRVKPGERVAACFMPRWFSGRLTEEAARSALGGERDGVLAGYLALDEDGLVPVPAHLSDEEAATLPCAAVTAWHALIASGRLSPGETVLLQGTGGVSLFALQFAKLCGARVIITSKSDEKLARAMALGADELINYDTCPEWQERVRELTGGLGVDHVVELGGAGTLAQSLRAVRLGGRISLIGVLAGAGTVDPLPILMKQVRVRGIFVGSREMFEAMNRAIAHHRLHPVVDRVFGFEEAGEAYRYLESQSHFGKVVIKVE